MTEGTPKPLTWEDIQDYKEEYLKLTSRGETIVANFLYSEMGRFLDTIDQLRSENATLRKERDELHLEAQRRNNTIALYSAEITDLTAERDQLRAQVDGLVENNRLISDDNLQLRAELAQNAVCPDCGCGTVILTNKEG